MFIWVVKSHAVREALVQTEDASWLMLLTLVIIHNASIYPTGQCTARWL